MATPLHLIRFLIVLLAVCAAQAGWQNAAPAAAGRVSTDLLSAATAKKKTTTRKKKTVAKKTTTAKKTTARKTTAKRAVSKQSATTAAASRSTSRSRVSRSRSRRSVARHSPWAVPTYADSTLGDHVDGDDLAIRRAAVNALGRYNGAVVVADPRSGRILSIVNQSTAVEKAYIPCSTVKVPVAMAAMSEGNISATTTVRVVGKNTMTLTEAMARSNNVYFERVGADLGFEKLASYHRLWGLGEKATLNLENEHPGVIPPAPPANGGAARMSSFGEGIQLTALQLASLLSAISNGGTLYYLQYPQNQEEVASFVPRVKRYLDINPFLDDLKQGMSGAVNFGTARRAAFSEEASLFGKTGTCTDYPQKTHMGWFGSFVKKGNSELVVVVMLTGADGVSGPVASGVAGKLYSNLDESGYFEQPMRYSPVALIDRGGVPNE